MDFSEKTQKYFENVYRFLTIRNRSEKEIRDYLTKKKAESEIISVIIEKLKQQKFLDDEAFARSWIRSRARWKPKGTHALKMELSQKGIAKEIIERVLSEGAEELPDQLTQAKQLIEKRISRLSGASKQEIYAKVGGFLSRRGFDWNTIKKAIDSFV